MRELEVKLPVLLRQFNGGEETVFIPSCKAGALPFEIARCCPLLYSHLFNEKGELSGFINVYVNDNNYVDIDENQPLSREDTIEIVNSLVGG